MKLFTLHPSIEFPRPARPGPGLFHALKSAAGFAACVLGCLLLATGPARAFTIKLYDVSSPPMTAVQLAAFQKAAKAWESEFWNLATVKLNVGLKTLTGSKLGETRPVMTTHSLWNTRLMLKGGAEDDTEEDVMNLLPGFTLPVTDIHGNRSDSKISMTFANAKALGLGTTADPIWGPPLANGADGQVIFNRTLANNNQFDYDGNGSVSGSQIDFVAVATHEIGHALGFVSVSDAQDANPTFTLHPAPLDLWRFPQTGGPHDLTTGRRLITAGPAEYYDTALNHVQFSRGVLASDGNCLCACGPHCQASHWRDNLLNQLMDPVLAWGEHKVIHNDDRHALDFIGWDRPVYFQPWNPPVALNKCKFRWYCWPCPPPEVDPGDPVNPPDINPPFAPTMSFGMSLDMPVCNGQSNTVRRSATGVAIFSSNRTNTHPPLAAAAADSDVELFPAQPAVSNLPPAFLDMYLVSDTSNGVPFTARAMFSDGGAEYDPTLGRYGGYRITLALDGLGDGVVGDVDGVMTIELLADAHRVPDLSAQNIFQIAAHKEDNSLRVFDALALGLCDVGPKSEHEPNNTAATANGLGAAGFTAVTGAIGATNDVDYYRFSAPTNSKVWITLDTGGTPAPGANSRNSIVTLLAADGVTAIEMDDDDGSGNGGDGTLESGAASALAGRTLTAGGTYYVRVSGYPPNSIINPYRLLLTVTAGAIPNEVEANNSMATATPILSLGQNVGVRSGRIPTSNDVDFYRVQVSTRSLLHVSADCDPERNGTSIDVLLTLFDGGGVPKFTANSSTIVAAGNPYLAEGFCYVLPGAGTYYVRVSGAAGVTGTYHLMTAACPLPAPHVSISSGPGGTVAISWPATLGTFRLQSSSNLTAWTDYGLTAPAPDDEGRITVTAPAAARAQFFRLMAVE